MSIRIDGELSASRLADLARSIGGTYRAQTPEMSVPYSGSLEVYQTSSGLSVALSDLVSEFDAEQCGTVPKSVTIAIPVGGAPVQADLSPSRTVEFRSGNATMVALSDRTMISTRTKVGQRTRLVKIHAQTDRISHPTIAEAVSRLTQGTASLALGIKNGLAPDFAGLFTHTADPLMRLLRIEVLAFGLLERVATEAAPRAIAAARPVRRRQVDAALDRLRDRILAEPGAPYALASLSVETGMSVPALTRSYRDRFGISVFASIREARLLAARAALAEGGTIAEAAGIAGYGHISNFSTAFRRRFGVTPGGAQEN
ncbi:MAG: AraC family transcriptional regulator [Pseudomonadota bacterium]